PGRRCVETSGNVIQDIFTSTPESRILDFSPIRLGTAKTARELAKSPDSLDSKLAPDDQNPFPGLIGRSSRLLETCARGNMRSRTRSGQSFGQYAPSAFTDCGKLHYSKMKTIVSLIYCAVAALGAVTVLSAQDVQTIWPVALAVAPGTWLSSSLIITRNDRAGRINRASRLPRGRR